MLLLLMLLLRLLLQVIHNILMKELEFGQTLVNGRTDGPHVVEAGNLFLKKRQATLIHTPEKLHLRLCVPSQKRFRLKFRRLEVALELSAINVIQNIRLVRLCLQCRW